MVSIYIYIIYRGFIMQKLVLKTNLNLTLARIITYTGEIGIFFPAIYTRLYLK